MKIVDLSVFAEANKTIIDLIKENLDVDKIFIQYNVSRGVHIIKAIKGNKVAYASITDIAIEDQKYEYVKAVLLHMKKILMFGALDENIEGREELEGNNG